MLHFMYANNTDAIEELRDLNMVAFESSWRKPILLKNDALITLESDERDKRSFQNKVKARATIAKHKNTIYDVALMDCVNKDTIARIAFGPITLPKQNKKAKTSD